MSFSGSSKWEGLTGRDQPAGGTVETSRTAIVEGAIVKAFNNPDFADVKIHLDKLELPAHSLILAAQSEYFDNALKSEFKEGTTKEFKYSDGSLQAYWRVFEYLYTGKYSEDQMPALGVQDDDELSKDLRVYSLADYFGIKGLKEYALGRFKTKIQQLWVSEAFVDCIREIYASTSDHKCGMREAVVGVVRENRSKLWEKKPFRELIHEGGDFVVDLMDKLIK